MTRRPPADLEPEIMAARKRRKSVAARRAYFRALGRIVRALGITTAATMTAGAFALAVTRQPAEAVLAGSGFAGLAVYAACGGLKAGRFGGALVAAAAAAMAAAAWGVF